MNKLQTNLCACLIGLTAMTTFNVQAQNHEKLPALDAIPKSGPTIQQVGIKPSFSNVSFSNESKTQTLDVYLPNVSMSAHPFNNTI